jgi:hypothetical protein
MSLTYFSDSDVHHCAHHTLLSACVQFGKHTGGRAIGKLVFPKESIICLDFIMHASLKAS